MKDQQLFFFGLGGESAWETLTTLGTLTLSWEARTRYREYRRMRRLFACALADPDSLVEIRIESTPRISNRNLFLAALLALLLLGVAIEWRSYTIPMIIEWSAEMLHKCGVQ